jgi:hypothetical protein
MTSEGRDKLTQLFYTALGLPLGIMAPIGTWGIETILNKEFPNG